MRFLAPFATAVKVLSVLLILLVGAVLVFVGVAVFGGRGTFPAPSRADAAITRHMPEFRYREAWEVGIDASPADVYAAFRRADWRRSRELRPLLALAEVPGRTAAVLTRSGWPDRRVTLDGLILNRRLTVLEDSHGKHLVVGTVVPMRDDLPDPRPVSPGSFASFEEPGYAKAVWSLEAVPRNGGGTRLVVEWRVRPTDAAAARRLGRVWFVAGPAMRTAARMSLPRVARFVDEPGEPVH